MNATKSAEPLLLRASEVARLFQVSPRTVAAWAKRGILPAVEVGGVRRWRRSDVDRLIASAQPARPQRTRTWIGDRDARG